MLEELNGRLSFISLDFMIRKGIVKLNVLFQV